MARAKVSAQATKLPRPLIYPYHIREVIGHKLTTCPKFSEMHNTFKDKGNKTTKKKHVDVKVIIAFLNIVNMHVATTKSKVIKIQKFKEHEPRKNKGIVD